MRNIVSIMIIAVACLQTALAQSRYQNTLDISPSKFEAPRFVDIDRFRKDIKDDMMLKEIYDQQKRDTLVGIYMYAFEVGFDGKIHAATNHNPKDFEKLQQYVESVFNNYRWLPAFKKGCPRCKLLSYVELDIYFNTEDKESNVYVEIRMLHRPKQKKRVLLSYRIPYRELR